MRARSPYDASMTHLQSTGVIVASLLLTASMTAQSEDWQVLKGIREGSRIKVILKHRRTFGYCQFVDVTDDALGCYYTSLGYRRYARDEVREVTVGHNSMKTGFFIGAGAGAVAGLSNGSGGGAGRLLATEILVPVMGLIGGGIGAAIDPLRHGTTVFRAADSAPALAGNKPDSKVSRRDLEENIPDPR